MEESLSFNGQTFSVVEHGGQPCLTLAEIARALYGQGGTQTATPFETRVRDLYRRHAGEFTSSMTALVKMKTPGGEQDVRVFSLRGAHLLGMFARTERAKAFRRWVLDVLDERAARADGLLPLFQAALAEYSSKKAVASLCGRGLNQWKGEKPPLEDRMRELSERMQPSLFIH